MGTLEMESGELDGGESMKRVSILIVSMILAIVGTTVVQVAKTSAAETVVKLKVQSMYGKTHFSRQFVDHLLPLLEKHSKSRFKFTYYPGEALMSGPASFDGLREGVLDMAVTAPAYAVDRMGIVGATQFVPGNWDYESWQKHSREPGSFYDWAEPYYNKVGLKLVSTICSQSNFFSPGCQPQK